MQTWFQAGTVVATGDLTPPFAPGSDYISHWNADGAGGSSYLVSQFPYYSLLNAADALGVSAEIVQRLWLSTLYAGSAAAGVFLALSVTQSSIAGGVAGLLLAFNPYRLVIGTDPVPLAAFMLAGLLGGILLRAALAGRSGTPQLAAFALVSTGLGYVFINPPHVLLLLLWLAACTGVAWAAGGVRALRKAWGFLARAAPLVLLVNLWWVVPAVLTISSPSFDDQFTAASSSSWAWTQQRASLLNGVSLNTAWGWNEAAYFPYAPHLDRFPFVQLRVFLAFLALVGLVVVEERTRLVAVALGTIALVGVVIAKGYHPPMTHLNAWFYEHLPGYWLLRDPMKALLLTTLAFAMMGGLGVDRLIRLGSSFRPAGVAIAFVLVGGTLASVYPIYTGEVVPDSRPLLPPAHVQMPESWVDAARFVNAQPRGRVLVLPAAAYYQLGTTWGYYGASFLAHAIHQPLIELTPGGYLSAGGSVSELVNAAQQKILAGDGDSALRYLRTLGVRYVVLRLDLDPSKSLHPVAHAGQIAHGLSRVPELRPIRRFEHVAVYELAGGERSDVRTAIGVPFAGSSGDAVSALDVTRPAYSLFQDPTEITNPPSPEEVVSPGGRVRLVRAEDQSLWEAWMVFQAGGHSLRLIDPVQMTIHNARVPHLKSIEVDVGVDAPAILEIGTNRYPVDGNDSRPVRLGLLRLSPTQKIRVWQRLKTAPLRLATAGPVSDCNRYDARTAEQVGLSRSILSVGGSPTLQLSARDHTACVSFPIEPLDKAALYRVSFEYRAVDGAGSRACLFEEGLERCAALPALDPSFGWHRVDQMIVPHRKTTGLRLFFYADGTGEGSITQYRRAAVSRYELSTERSLPAESLGFAGELSLPKGLLPLETQSPLTQPYPIRLTTAPPVSDCDRADARTPEQVGLSRSVLSVGGVPTLQLSARDHAACVNFSVEPLDKAALYRVRFEYRTFDGTSPRACLFEEGPGRCAALPALDPSPDWQRVDAVIAPHRTTQGLRLFFYANGTGERMAIAQYRHVRVSAVASAAPVLLGAPPPNVDLPDIRYVRVGPAELRARVIGAIDPFLLVLTESFAAGWKIEVTGRDDSQAQHVRVDGYANGWVVPWQGSYDVRLYYEPEVLARVARWADLVIIPAVFGLFIVGRRRNRRKGVHQLRTMKALDHSTQNQEAEFIQ